MPHVIKACPFAECNGRRFGNISDHLTHIHKLRGEDRKRFLHIVARREGRQVRDTSKKMLSGELTPAMKPNVQSIHYRRQIPAAEENIYYEPGESVLKFISPTAIFVCGVSQSGKSHFIRRLLRESDAMFTQKPDLIVYCFSESEPDLENLREHLPKLITHQGLPTREDIAKWSSEDGSFHTILVLDDMIQKLVESQDICY